MLKKAGLYIVATPIGNLGDMSLRAIEVLKNVDYIAAEDTRHSHKLLVHFAIKTPLISLHKYNESQRSQLLLTYLEKNRSIALISDAGTPLISDPGHRLVGLAHKKDIPVIPIPGPCALITALSAAGLECNRFIFEGFLPEKKTSRQKKLQELLYETRTLIFYEAPHRIVALVEDMLSIFGPDRYVVLARELTKTFETIYGNHLNQLKIWLNCNERQQKGEFVVLVAGSKQAFKPCDIEISQTLYLLLNALPTKQAVALASQITHEKKNKLYARALTLTGKTR